MLILYLLQTLFKILFNNSVQHPGNQLFLRTVMISRELAAPSVGNDIVYGNGFMPQQFGKCINRRCFHFKIRYAEVIQCFQKLII